MSKDKASIEYEILAQEIYQALLKNQEITNVKVEHNIHLAGKSGQKHQIDVYWEYEIAGTIHKVAIECKNYSSVVSIGKVRDFASVLADLNNVCGIMLTKIGYQSGAKTFADHYGILLKELRIPTDRDWEGRIREIKVQMNAVMPHIKQRTPLWDAQWIKDNVVFPEDGNIKLEISGLNTEMFVYDDKGEPICSFYDLDNKVPHETMPTIDAEHVFPFDNGYLNIHPVGKLKIKGIKYIYDVTISSEEFSISAEEMTKAILRDALTGKIQFFDRYGNVRG